LRIFTPGGIGYFVFKLSLIFSQFFSVIPAQAGIQAIWLIFLDSLPARE
jgi:hypothetical protein